MINLIFIAPPAAGKGTQSELLKERYEFEHISTGDLLREVATSGTELGNQIKSLIDKGMLVEDELVMKMLKEKLITLQNAKGVVFDGSPRTIKQAMMLEDILKSLNQKVDYVMYLDVDRDLAMRRALGRITCPNCKAIYNSYNSVFDKQGFCNKCGSELEIRKDDNEETFIARFETYLVNSKPLVDFYKEKGLLHIINVGEEKEETFTEIEKVLKKRQ